MTERSWTRVILYADSDFHQNDGAQLDTCHAEFISASVRNEIILYADSDFHQNDRVHLGMCHAEFISASVRNEIMLFADSESSSE